jgi:antitoxin MazE
MNAIIQKWGNSQGIRIPKIILEKLGFHENDKVEIITNEDSIILKKANKPKHITLEERLEMFYGKPIEKIEAIEQLEELDFGKPVGEEIW